MACQNSLVGPKLFVEGKKENLLDAVEFEVSTKICRANELCTASKITTFAILEKLFQSTAFSGSLVVKVKKFKFSKFFLVNKLIFYVFCLIAMFF